MTLAARVNDARAARVPMLQVTNEIPPPMLRDVGRGRVAFFRRTSILGSGRHNPADNLQKAGPVLLRLSHAPGCAAEETGQVSEVQDEPGEEAGPACYRSG